LNHYRWCYGRRYRWRHRERRYHRSAHGRWWWRRSDLRTYSTTEWIGHQKRRERTTGFLHIGMIPLTLGNKETFDLSLIHSFRAFIANELEQLFSDHIPPLY
jgi:hypothetical protein